MRVSVGYQGEIAYSFIGFNIGYVCNPYFIGAVWYDTFNEIGIFAIIMVGIRCPISLSSLYLHHKTVLAKQLDKGITTGHTTCIFKQGLDNQI
jgi:hypothetical protein